MPAPAPSAAELLRPPEGYDPGLDSLVAVGAVGAPWHWPAGNPRRPWAVDYADARTRREPRPVSGIRFFVALADANAFVRHWRAVGAGALFG